MIAVRFSCKECGLKDIRVSVSARQEDEDVVHWVEKVMTVALCQRHALLSPSCRPKQLSDLKIPIEPDDHDGWIGKQTDIVPPEGDSST